MSDYWYRNAQRLLRKKWRSPSELAEELYAIVSSQPPPIDHPSRTVAEQEPASHQSPPIERPRLQLLESPSVERTVESQPEAQAKYPSASSMRYELPPKSLHDEPYVVPLGVDLATQLVSPALPPKVLPPFPTGVFPVQPLSPLPPPVSFQFAAQAQSTADSQPPLDSPPVETELPPHIRVGFQSFVGYNSGFDMNPQSHTGNDKSAGDPLTVDGSVYGKPSSTVSVMPSNHDAFRQDSYALRFPTVDWDSPRPGGGGDKVIWGRVTGGKGSKWEVMLYPDGPEGDPSPDEAVEVTIPMIHADEVPPDDMWICPVTKDKGSDGKTKYYAQPTVWLDGPT